jgi:hypothetical protein
MASGGEGEQGHEQPKGKGKKRPLNQGQGAAREGVVVVAGAKGVMKVSSSFVAWLFGGIGTRVWALRNRIEETVF